VLSVLTTDEFAEWFATLDDPTAESVATAVEVVEQLGPQRAPPASRESLLWYEHPSVSCFEVPGSLSWQLEAWGAFREYARKALVQLESKRFVSRLMSLSPADAETVLRSIRRIRRVSDPRARWSLKRRAALLASDSRVEDAREEVRRLYFEALGAAGFSLTDVPAHSLALRELSQRFPPAGFRLLYGVHAERETALFVLGEPLGRTFYGHSVRRAEALWRQFLDGTLRDVEPAQLR
jgi:hypothetical protein